MFTDVNDDSSDLDKKRIEMQIGRLSIVLDDKFILESCLSTAINLTFFFRKSKAGGKKKTLPRAKHTNYYPVIKIERKEMLSFGGSIAVVTSLKHRQN